MSEQRQDPGNARFWVYWNETWTKLTLRPLQALSVGRSYRTDEGWFAEGYTWSHEGDHVLRQYGSQSKDCDGRLDRSEDCECALSGLGGTFIDDDAAGIKAPLWRSVQSSQRDHAAEAMGY